MGWPKKENLFLQKTKEIDWTSDKTKQVGYVIFSSNISAHISIEPEVTEMRLKQKVTLKYIRLELGKSVCTIDKPGIYNIYIVNKERIVARHVQDCSSQISSDIIVHST